LVLRQRGKKGDKTEDSQFVLFTNYQVIKRRRFGWAGRVALMMKIRSEVRLLAQAGVAFRPSGAVRSIAVALLSVRSALITCSYAIMAIQVRVSARPDAAF